LKDNISKNEEIENSEIQQALDSVIVQMQACITGFQFFDAKRQRLENVSDGLADLEQYIDENIDINSNVVSLEKKIVGLYKMESEHVIYREFLEEKNPNNT